MLAVSDLHVSFRENREIVANLRPESAADWLLVAGDVGDISTDIEWALGTLRERFGTVVWSPGNHELWTHPADPLQLRGEQRYRHLVGICRELGVLTPEDPYPVWPGAGGPAVVAPLFLLYDYTFLPPGAATKNEAIALALSSGVVCTDEWLLHPDPHPSREAWCRVRVDATVRRLEALDPAMPTILMNHFPLVRDPTRDLRHPVFAQWCGTEQSAGWHLRYRAGAVVYGHLHMPRTTWHDGVRFEEVSLGYPGEWQRRPGLPYAPRQILPLSRSEMRPDPLPPQLIGRLRPRAGRRHGGIVGERDGLIHRHIRQC
jgi:3',5'-cyclic AMP phosphodiesterase CpdA